MHQFFDRFLHRFFIDFCSFLEANLGPCWPHFRSKWGDPVACSPLLCWVYVLFRFFGHPGPVLAPFGLDLGGSGAGFWEVFGLDFGSFWRQFGHTTPLGKPALSIRSAGVWFWMGWWGYAKRKEYSTLLLFNYSIVWSTFITCEYLRWIIVNLAALQ